jgi:hypothetical protein
LCLRGFLGVKFLDKFLGGCISFSGGISNLFLLLSRFFAHLFDRFCVSIVFLDLLLGRLAPSNICFSSGAGGGI